MENMSLGDPTEGLLGRSLRYLYEKLSGLDVSITVTVNVTVTVAFPSHDRIDGS
jgi:hypothetical protein